jgi:hypothetical protein
MVNYVNQPGKSWGKETRGSSRLPGWFPTGLGWGRAKPQGND